MCTRTSNLPRTSANLSPEPPRTSRFEEVRGGSGEVRGGSGEVRGGSGEVRANLPRTMGPCTSGAEPWEVVILWRPFSKCAPNFDFPPTQESAGECPTGLPRHTAGPTKVLHFTYVELGVQSGISSCFPGAAHQLSEVIFD